MLCTYQELLKNKPLPKVREKKNSNQYNIKMEKNPKPFSPHSLSHLSCVPGYKGTISLSIHHKEQHLDRESSSVAGEPVGQTPLRYGHTQRALLTLELAAVGLPLWSSELIPGSVRNCLKCLYVFFLLSSSVALVYGDNAAMAQQGCH